MAKPVAKIVALLTPKRRWTQFSLCTMFLTVTVLCVWLALHVASANRQRAAVAAIRELAGKCFYDYQFDANGQFHPASEPPGPAWLRESLGIDHLANVVDASLLSDASTPLTLKHLPNLPKLARLHIVYVGQPLAEEEITAFQSLRGLRELRLIGATDTDTLLEAAAGLSSLEALHVSSGDTGEDGLRHIGRMTKLQRLSLIGVHVGDTGLAHLARLDNLTELQLIAIKTSDFGLIQLRKLKSLRKLRLVNVDVTDAGIVHLRGLTGLRDVYFGETDVTDAGVSELQKVLPNCKIGYSPLSHSGRRR